MITEALRHCAGIGPRRLAQLADAGICSWQDVVGRPDAVPARLRDSLVDECRQLLTAKEDGNIRFFVERLAPQDKWRILAEYFDRTSFFDIETSGLEYDAHITVIVCWHRGELRIFVEHENLDDFLGLLDDVDLLASFNGSTFDVPRVLDAFHIPELPCPHIDLRWPCFHHGLAGGLKDIATRIGIERPTDIADADGELAIQLWFDWRTRQDAAAREGLIRYCAADVLMLIPLTQHLAGLEQSKHEDFWKLLPTSSATGSTSASGVRNRGALVSDLFGDASPSKLRTRRRSAG